MSNILQDKYIIRYNQYLQQRKETQQEILAVFEQKEISDKQRLNIPYKLRTCLNQRGLMGNNELFEAIGEMRSLDRCTIATILEQMRLELQNNCRKQVAGSEHIVIKSKRGRLCLEPAR